MIGSVRVLESRFVQSCTNIANAPQISNAEIAILGRSNVGKSSLINALLNNKNLAKSSSTPGKTKLVNFFVSKWKVESVESSGNSPLELHSADSANFECSQTPSLVSHSKFAENYESQTENPSVVLNGANSSSLRGRIADSHEAIHESKIDCYDSANPESRNDENIKNQNANSKIFDEIVPQRESANEAHLAVRRSEADLSCDAISQKAEFVIHILDFPGFGFAKVSKSERDSWDKNLSTFLKKRESIKLFIHLIDSRHTNLALDNEIRTFLRSIVRADADILEVFTKADKLKKSEIHALKGRILVSTTKKDLGQGDLKDSIESLRHAILRTMYHI